MSERRDCFWDWIKGVAIVAVVLIHTTSFNSFGGVIWRQFINFPVALFFMMAGYFCHYDGSYGKFIQKKARRLLIPLFCVSICKMLWRLRSLNAIGEEISMQNVCLSFLDFSLGWGYFVWALFQCFLLAPILMRMTCKHAVVFGTVGYFVSAAYLYAASIFPDSGLTLRFSIPFILWTSWMLFFVIGLKHGELTKKIAQLPRLTWGLVLLIVVTILGASFWYGVGCIQLARSQLRLSSVALSVCISFYVLFADSLESAHRMGSYGVLAVLGRYSFFIYLWHWFVIKGIKMAVGCDCGTPFTALVLALSVLVVFSTVLYILPNRLKRKLWFLGL